AGVVRGGLDAFEATITGIMDSAANVTDRIRRLLEEFRRYMITGIPEIGLPILDPLSIERIDLNITNEQLTLVGFVDDVKVKYLSKFRLDHINYKMSQSILELNITFSQLDIKGYYDIDGQVGEMFKFYGKGRFWLHLYGLSIGTISRIRITPSTYPPFYVHSMRITPKLRKLENNFEGLMNNTQTGDTFNKAITRLAPAALDTLWPEIEDKVSAILISIINDKIR
ncbi:hemolymph juvenile hormone-binding protein, partial [Oryctes borbonicus]